MPSKYQLGYKYCPRCVAYYQTDEVRCPVCGAILRAKPRKKSKSIQLKAVTPPKRGA